MDPIAEAVRLHELATEHAANGLLAEAECCCRGALLLLEDSCGPSHPDVANVLCALGRILGLGQKWSEAEDAAGQALEIMEAAAADMDRREADLILLEALAVLGTALRQQGRYREAEAPLRRAVAVAGEHPRESMLLAEACNNLGVLFKYTGNFLEAEMHYRRALVVTECTVGRQSAMAATLYHNLGGLEHARRRFDRGLLPAQRAYQIRCELLGPDHPDTVADAAALAGILDGLGRYAESRPIYRHALEVFERHYGPEHYEIAVNLNNLAAMEHAEGRLDEAEQLYRRALAMKERLLGPRHPDTAMTAHNLALVLHDRKRAAEAQELIERALESFQEALGSEHPKVAVCRDSFREIAQPAPR